MNFMGMFDNVTVADKLPVNDEMVKLGLDKNVFVFQTKDMHCCLDNYIIQGGKLFEKKYKTIRWVDEPNSFLGGRMKREDPYLVDVQYHGLLNFYHHETVGNLTCWIEYVAKFTDGVVEKIELKEFRTRDNTEEKANLEAIFAEAERNHNKWYNKYFFHTKPWSKIRKVLCNVLVWMERKLYDLRMNLP